MNRPLAILDVDGVVADMRHRLPLLDRKPADWTAFFGRAADDPPLAEGIELATRLAEDHELVWLTGRPERLRDLTSRWLAAHALPAQRLIMRRNRDFRPARVAKLEALRRLVAERPVAIVVDDDPLVVEAVRGAGLPVRLADWLPYRPSLRRVAEWAQEGEGRT